MAKNQKSFSKTLIPISLLALLVLAITPAAFASFTPATVTPATITAGGSSFVNPVMQVWTVGFGDYTSGAVQINYAAVGSTNGYDGVTSGTYAYAGSDIPWPSSDWSTAACQPGCGTLLQIPETLGGVAIFYNIPGVTKSLNLTGPIIADIYLQHIQYWNNSAITSINPGVNPSLLNQLIIPVHRLDGSGTTYALTTFFTRTSTDWNASGLGIGATVAWPNTPNPELAASGSSGVAADVKANSYSIGYADSYYALSNKLLSGSILNQAGQYLQPTLATIAAAASADAAKVNLNPTYSITNAPGTGSYAISTYTYILIWENQPSQGVGSDLAQFLWWVVTTGQSDGPPLNYPALTANIVTIDEHLIAELNYQGTPFITITSASVTCKPSPITVGQSSLCTALITGGAKGGAVSWAASGAGTFSSPVCILSKALSCSTVFFSAGAGTTDIVASYITSSGDGGSNGQFALTVSQKASHTTLTCTPKTISTLGGTTICKATVIGFSPTGTVTFSQSVTGGVSFSSSTCTLGKPTKTTASCTVTVTGNIAGKDTLTASYGGDTNNVASAKTHALTTK